MAAIVTFCKLGTCGRAFATSSDPRYKQDYCSAHRGREKKDIKPLKDKKRR